MFQKNLIDGSKGMGFPHEKFNFGVLTPLPHWRSNENFLRKNLTLPTYWNKTSHCEGEVWTVQFSHLRQFQGACVDGHYRRGITRKYSRQVAFRYFKRMAPRGGGHTERQGKPCQNREFLNEKLLTSEKLSGLMEPSVDQWKRQKSKIVTRAKF